MFKSTTKKLIALALAIGCSAAFAYPPPFYFCNKECIKQLKEYFAGTRQSFELPIFQIGTDFQQKVWNKIYKIPYGDTSTYSLLANNLGNTNSTRTVAAANGKNKIAIIVPCHRVIGSDGSLTGYTWGLDKKEWLLKHEIEHSGPVEGRLF